MIRRICDRCCGSDEADTLEFSYSEGRLLGKSDEFPDLPSRVELCGECARDLMEFFKLGRYDNKEKSLTKVREK